MIPIRGTIISIVRFLLQQILFLTRFFALILFPLRGRTHHTANRAIQGTAPVDSHSQAAVQKVITYRGDTPLIRAGGVLLTGTALQWCPWVVRIVAAGAGFIYLS